MFALTAHGRPVDKGVWGLTPRKVCSDFWVLHLYSVVTALIIYYSFHNDPYIHIRLEFSGHVQRVYLFVARLSWLLFVITSGQAVVKYVTLLKPEWE
jgi:hypothetical protein